MTVTTSSCLPYTPSATFPSAPTYTSSSQSRPHQCSKGTQDPDAYPGAPCYTSGTAGSYDPKLGCHKGPVLVYHRQHRLATSPIMKYHYHSVTSGHFVAEAEFCCYSSCPFSRPPSNPPPPYFSRNCMTGPCFLYSN